MVSDMRSTLPELPPFNWEREYGPLWTGSDCSAFWLAPEPDDMITIDGIRAPLRDHINGTAKQRQIDVEANRRFHYEMQMAALQQISDGGLANYFGRGTLQ